MANRRKLTDAFIKSIETDKRIEIYDTTKGANGLVLRVTPTGHKSFALRYWYDGQSKQFTIGTYGTWSLAGVRDETKRLKQLVDKGVDPAVEKRKNKEKKRELTFFDLATRFKDIHLKSLREKTRREHTRIIDNELIPAFGKTPAKELEKGQIISFLDDKAIIEGKKTMANRIRARLHSVYEFGVHRGLVDLNPVSGVKPYPEGETKRERYYTEKELRLLWKAFERQAEPAGSVMKMLLLSGQRKTETMNMKWSDLSGDVWTIPAELAKGKRSHDVPLSDMALDIIERMKTINGQSDYIFTSPVLDNTPIQEIKRSVKNVRQYSENDFSVKDFRLHDLRRTAATYMAKLNVDRTTLGKLLNHKGLSGDGQVTAIYDRHSYMDEKRTALQKWANYLQSILDNQRETKIHQIG